MRRGGACAAHACDAVGAEARPPRWGCGRDGAWSLPRVGEAGEELHGEKRKERGRRWATTASDAAGSERARPPRRSRQPPRRDGDGSRRVRGGARPLRESRAPPRVDAAGRNRRNAAVGRCGRGAEQLGRSRVAAAG